MRWRGWGAGVLLLAVACVGPGSDRPVHRARSGCASYGVEPGLPAGGDLVSISGSGHHLWAAGTVDTRTGERALFVHFDGTQRTRVPAPSTARGGHTIESIAVGSPTTAWAVGYVTVGGDPSPLAMRWDGHEWRSVPIPPALDRSTFRAVALDGADVWIAGVAAGERDRPLLVRFDGRSWRSWEMPGPDHSWLSDIAAAGGRVWAVGYHGIEPIRPLAFGLVDGRWHRSHPDEVLDRGHYAGLMGVDVSAAGRVVAVGYERRSARHARALALRMDGGEWRRTPVADPIDVFLWSVDAADDGATWAVGSGVERRQPVAVRVDDGSARRVEVPKKWELSDVARDSEGRVFAVGGDAAGSVDSCALITRLD